MSHTTWTRHTDQRIAVDVLLDAAGRCFADLGVARATMVDVARAAGCSRATLYRYFPNQDALREAFVHRATLRIAAQMAAERDAGAPDSLVDRILSGIEQVRADPMLAVWFEPENMAVPMAVSQSSELLRSMSAGLIGDSDDSLDRAEVELRAQWLLRSIVSLLALPGPDPTAERSMVESFVVPVITAPLPSTRSAR